MTIRTQPAKESRRSARKNRKLRRQGLLPALPPAPPPPPAPTPTQAAPAKRPRKKARLRPAPRYSARPERPPPPRVKGLAKLVTNISTAYWLLSVATAGGSTAQLLHTRARAQGSGWIEDELLDRTLRELSRSKFLRYERGANYDWYVLTREGEDLLEEMWDLRYTLAWTDPEDEGGYQHE